VPSVFLRELAAHKQAKLIFTVRDAIPFRVDIAAAAATESAWVAIAPHKDWAAQPLSAYAIELYQTCPLKFKLARDWALPAEPAAMMQFGSVMHRVLADYYNSVMAKTPYSEEQVLAMFRDQLAASGMEDPLQRDLYSILGAS